MHESWDSFVETSAGGQHFYFTRAADVSALDVDYTAPAAAAAEALGGNSSGNSSGARSGSSNAAVASSGSNAEKIYLLFGAETTGFTPEAEAASLDREGAAGGLRVAL